jgi:hypothetical protein
VKVPILLAAVLATAPGASAASAPTIDSYSKDARILAACLSDGPRLDLAVTAELESVLALVRKERAEFQDIHAIPDYDLHTLIVQVRPGRAPGWGGSSLRAGERDLDSLAQVFGLREVAPLGFHPPRGLVGCYTLRFDESLCMPKLAELYARSAAIESADLNSIIGDGDRIWAMKKAGTWNVVLSHGWGDCMAGCVGRSFSYISLQNSGATRIMEEWEGYPPPRLYLWNVPPDFPGTVFVGASALLDSLDSPRWWVRRHAIEAAWRFLRFDDPWTREGPNQRDSWERTRAELREGRAQVVRQIWAKLRDPDPDIRASAALALEKLTPGRPSGPPGRRESPGPEAPSQGLPNYPRW